MNEEKNRENRLRAKAKRQGIVIKKLRAAHSGDNYGGYQIIDENNFIKAGERFELDIDDVEDYLNQ